MLYTFLLHFCTIFYVLARQILSYRIVFESIVVLNLLKYNKRPSSNSLYTPRGPGWPYTEQQATTAVASII